jgi:hypothetical protein
MANLMRRTLVRAPAHDSAPRSSPLLVGQPFRYVALERNSISVAVVRLETPEFSGIEELHQIFCVAI